MSVLCGECVEAAYRPDSVLIQTRKSLSVSELNSLLRSKETCRSISPSGIRPVYSIQLGASKNPLERIRELKKDPAVLYAEPNYIHYLHETVPDDSYFASRQWALNNTGQQGGAFGEDIDAPEGWDIETGDGSVLVSVIDTGISLGHSDLASRIWTNPGEIPGDGVDNDGNGYIDDWRGWNFEKDSNDPSDVHSHGTHVSGIIGAVGNNGGGIAGVCWNCTIQPLACFDSWGEATNEDVVEAIYYAIDSGAQVINASWGDLFHSEILDDAIRAANENQVLFVASAGNEGLRDVDYLSAYPAQLDFDNVIAVAASGPDGQIAGYSNQGPSTIDIVAPGSTIYSCIPVDTYGNKSGTSMAAPIVTGSAALVLSHYPGISLAELRGRILGSVDVLPDYEERVASGGRLNIAKMFEEDTTPPGTVGDLEVIRSGWDGITLRFTTTGDDGTQGSPSGFDLRYSETPISEATWASAEKARVAPRLNGAGVTHTTTVRGLQPDKSYFFGVKVYDNVGNHSSLSNVASGTTAKIETVWFDAVDGSGTLLSPSPVGSWAKVERVEGATSDYCWTESPAGEYGNNVESFLVSEPFHISEDTWLTFEHWHDFYYVNGYLSDGGEVQVRPFSDSAGWTTIARFYSTNSPWRREIVSLRRFSGLDSSAQIRFRFFSDSTATADGWYIDNVRVFVPEEVAWPEDIIVESTTRFRNAFEPEVGYQETISGGIWFSDTLAKARRYGLDGVSARMKYVDTVGSTAIFRPYVPESGWYEVYGIWGSLANAVNLNYRVKHSFGEDNVFVTQNPTANANQWVLLGTYFFQSGRDGQQEAVVLDDSTVTGSSNASKARVDSDAVRWVFTGKTGPVQGNFMQLLGE